MALKVAGAKKPFAANYFSSLLAPAVRKPFPFLILESGIP